MNAGSESMKDSELLDPRHACKAVSRAPVRTHERMATRLLTGFSMVSLNGRLSVRRFSLSVFSGVNYKLVGDLIGTISSPSSL